ncbi:MAG: YibE/F family protein [Lachnospiraceae bacterium]|nr:YibE/F family protein [Lachnospiraceae bacterium]
MEILLNKFKKNNIKNIAKIFLAVLIIVGAVIFTKFDYFLYEEMIGTVIEIDNKEFQAENDKRESYCIQKLKIKIRNTQDKGEIVTAENKFLYSEVNTTEYKKGDDVFIEESEIGSTDVIIIKSKIDTYVIFILLSFIAIIILIAGKKGVLSLISLLLNIGIFILALNNFVRSENIVFTTSLVTVLFISLTLILLNGLSKKSLGAIISSFITVIIIFIIYMITFQFGERPYFEMMDYIFGNENLEALFLTSVIFGSLGAIMDVTITINSTVSEIVSTAINPTVGALIKSVKEVSNDIMGTMINVLFFSYLSGSIPLFIIKAKNGYSFMNLVRYDVVFEILRFLTGSIGIVMAIPVSGLVAILIHKKRLK